MVSSLMALMASRKKMHFSTQVRDIKILKNIYLGVRIYACTRFRRAYMVDCSVYWLKFAGALPYTYYVYTLGSASTCTRQRRISASCRSAKLFNDSRQFHAVFTRVIVCWLCMFLSLLV